MEQLKGDLTAGTAVICPDAGTACFAAGESALARKGRAASEHVREELVLPGGDDRLRRFAFGAEYGSGKEDAEKRGLRE